MSLLARRDGRWKVAVVSARLNSYNIMYYGFFGLCTPMAMAAGKTALTHGNRRPTTVFPLGSFSGLCVMSMITISRNEL